MLLMQSSPRPKGAGASADANEAQLKQALQTVLDCLRSGQQRLEDAGEALSQTASTDLFMLTAVISSRVG